MSCLTAALDYCQRGLSVIPVNGQKKALVTWTPYQTRKASTEEITTWWKEWPGARIGIVTGVVSGLLVVDVDSKEGEEKINELLPDTLLTPACQTPRGGKHLYFACSDPRVGNATGILPGVDVRANGGYVVAPPSKGYCWLAGLALEEITPLALEGLPESLLSLINNKRYSFNNIDRGKEDGETPNKTLQTLQILTDGRRDNDLFHVANCMVKGGLEKEYITKALEIIALNCTPPFSLNEIPAKIKSAFGRAERRERNLNYEVQNWIDLTTGNFFLTETCNALQILTKEEKQNLYVIVGRLKEQGIVERVGSRNGCYRKIENQAEDIDIFQAEAPPLSIQYPLGIESLVYTMPKSIVVIAGESDAGKTAYLLSLAMLNMNKHKISYFSSEMGPTELRARIKNFERPIEDWKRVRFKERSDKFADVVEPDGINIIDYLEVHDEFYAVGGAIRDIFNKLTTGVAYIAIQKKIGAELARGGDFTMEKSRLYITLSRDHVCRIIKGKNWVNAMVKPTGMERKFALLHGCKWFPKSNWRLQGQEE